jgi:hypothetical protein
MLVEMMNRAARWILTRERFHNRPDAPDDDQVAIYNGQLIGSVRLETSGPRRGEWCWAMSRDGPDIDMRWERSCYEATEAEAKARVVESYEELLRRALAAVLLRQNGAS